MNHVMCHVAGLVCLLKQTREAIYLCAAFQSSLCLVPCDLICKILHLPTNIQQRCAARIRSNYFYFPPMWSPVGWCVGRPSRISECMQLMWKPKADLVCNNPISPESHWVSECWLARESGAGIELNTFTAELSDPHNVFLNILAPVHQINYN